MKYLVELKFTNPAHEHVSLRRRVESVTRLVEASNEDQAVLRASQQQRALGFFIKEAKIVKEKSHDKEGGEETIVAKGKEVMKKAEGKDEEDEEEAEDIEEGNGTASYPLLKPGQKLKPMKLKMGEGFDPEPSDIAAHLVKKHGKGKVTKDHVDEYERDRDSNKGIDKKAVMKHVQKMSEEVEQIDEEKKVTHEDPLVTVHDKHGVRTHAHLSTANDIHGTKVKYTEVHAGNVKAKSRSGDDLTFKISKHHAKEVNEASVKDLRVSMKAMDLRHGVDPDKREAGYKMSPAVKAAQAKSDALSKPEKKHQAGTLGAHKARKAAERMVDAAKSKVNKINMNPSLEPHAHSLKLNK